MTNRYFHNDNDKSRPNFFLSGSLHFGIKFYCSDEDGSSKLLFFFFLSVPTAVADRRFFVVKGRKMPAVGTYGHPPVRIDSTICNS